MSSASFALQQALYTALTNDPDLVALAGSPVRLYDIPPRAAVFPYLVFSEDTETAWNTAGDTGSEHIVSIRIWSRAGGRKEIKQIADAVVASLDDAAFALAGHYLVDMRFRKAVYTREADGKTFRAALEFRAITEPE
jgi:hypothetical protein